MINIETKNDKFTAFGGLAYIFNALSKSGLPKLIEDSLGKRGVRCTSYSYTSILKALIAIYFSGGESIEDVNEHRDFWSRDERMPSPDVVGRAMKELAVASERFMSKSGAEYCFNIAEKMNTLLVDSAKSLGLLDGSDELVLDYDNQLIATEKKDASYSYKQCFGYFPGVLAVGGVIVGVENRDGNAPVKLFQDKTLRRQIGRVEEAFPGRLLVFRADAGSYTTDVLSVVSEKCGRFYVRANTSKERRASYEKIDNWIQAELNGETFDTASMFIDGLLNGKTLRLVVQRTRRDDDTDLFNGEYIYRAIVTNDFDKSELEVIDFYNKRGAIERNFDMQNNDFGWAHMPFSNLHENTVFLVMTAIAKNFYLYFIKRCSKFIDGLERTSRVKRFVNKFVSVPAKWIHSGRRLVLKVYTPHNFYNRVAYLW